MTSTNKQLRRRIERLEMALRQIYDESEPCPDCKVLTHREIDDARRAAKVVLDEGVE